MTTLASHGRRELERAATILEALLSEAKRIGHSGDRAFISTVVANDVLHDAYALMDDLDSLVSPRAHVADPMQCGENIIPLRPRA